MMKDKSLFMRTLHGERAERPPIWLMRQAGRYLPEYRATRAEAGSFLDLCFNPRLAAEVTLQPIRRFDFDASILFSDILVIPWALGQDVRFEEGRGPVLKPIQSGTELAVLEVETLETKLEPVFEAIQRINEGLPDETPLIGFIGAPWTLMTYMIAGHSTPDQRPAKDLWLHDPQTFAAMRQMVEEACMRFLIAQVKAGVNVVKIFDSWAGSLPEALVRELCIDPIKRIVNGVRQEVGSVPVIAFPRGIGNLYPVFANEVDATVIAVDQFTDPSVLRLSGVTQPLQGNMDPMFLRGSPDLLQAELHRQRKQFAEGAHIVNLGHGITPDADIANVEKMIAFWRQA